jgi:hypothetical protein
MADPTSTLYATIPPKRYFYIPDETPLPPGPLELQSLTGKRLDLDPVVASVFEVSESEAQGIAAKKARAIAGSVARAVKGANEVLAGVQKAQQSGELPGPVAGPEQKARVAEALGIPAAALEEDPEAVIEGLKRAMQRLSDEARRFISTDPADQEIVRARMEALSDELTARGLPELSEPVKALPEELRRRLADPALEQSIREATERLKRAQQEVETGRSAEPRPAGEAPQG